jgi:hypothetical protein
MIFDCCTGKLNFMEFCVKEIMSNVVSTFNEIVSNKSNNDLKKNILLWIKTKYQSKFLYELLFSKIKSINLENVEFFDFLNWCSFCDKNINDKDNIDLRNLKLVCSKFKDFLNKSL